MLTRLLSSLIVFAATSSVHAQWEWVDNSNGSSNYARIEDVAVDSIRDVVYAVGFVDGNPNFPEIPNSDYNGQDDGVVMKYDLDGNVEYGFLIGGAGDDRIHGVTVDQSTGNIFVTGYIEGSGVNLFGAATGTSSVVSTTYGGEDAFVAMYNIFGQLVWYNVFGGSDLDRGMDIAINSSAVYITGVYTNSGGPSSFPSSISANSAVNNFVAALDKTTGGTLWNAAQGSSADDYEVPSFTFNLTRTGITADNNGVYAVNYFYGSSYDIYNSSGILSASIADPNNSNKDFVVTAYSNTGAYNWSALYDNLGDEVNGLDITNDCDGVYVTGTLHNGSITPDGTAISSNHDDIIISKLNKSSGSEIWLKEFDSNYDHIDYFLGLHADGYGNLYAVGRLRGTSLSSGTDFSYTGGASGSEVMIAHYHTDGTYQNFEVIPSSTYSWAMSIDTYKTEKYVIGGYYNNTITFGTIVPSVTTDNAFVATRTLDPIVTYTSNSGGNFAGYPVICQSEANPIPTINAPLGGTFTGPTEVVFADVNTGEINLAASTAGGPYTITYGGYPLTCEGSWSTIIYIETDGDATFTFGATQFCNNESNPLPTSINEPGGTFTAESGLELADATNGEIDLALSTPGGTYWLVYTTPGLVCPDSDSIQITISPIPDASFGYNQVVYCSGTGTELPSFIVTPGGAFTSSAGLIVNGSTGEIDLDNSIPGGPYDVQYIVNNGSCDDTVTVAVTITQSEDPTFTYASAILCANDPNVLPTSITTPGGVFFAPAGLTVANASTGEIEVSTSIPGGPYQLYYTTDGTCAATDSLEFYIVASLDPTFAYSQANYCSGGGTVLPSVVASPGGTFSGPVGIVFIDSVTGEIDLNASTVGGPYSIQYLAGIAPCQTSTTYNITIDPADDASFSYAASNFCQNEADPSPTVIATLGGTFTSTVGLVFNTSTGKIDVSASAPGPYTLVYTTAGACPSIDSVVIYIEDTPDPSFAYAQTAYCVSDQNLAPISIATVGGVFSSSPGLSIDSSTGEINLANSTAGSTYTIQYIVSNAFCQDTATFDITIIGQNSVSVEYSANDYCVSDGNQVPLITGATDGVFTGPTSIDLVDPSKGEISPSTSAVGGPYPIQFVSAGACPDSAEVLISIYDVVTAYAGEDQTLIFDFSSTLEADIPLNATGQWSTVSTAILTDEFDPNSDVTDLELGTNTFIWTVSNDVCPAVSDEVIIQVIDVFIPQAVTPNNDGKNDYFDLKIGEETRLSLQIFNRWGQLVYENSDYQNDWNGQNANGDELKNDTYFYTLLVNDSITYNGYVVLKK
ncbi:MAG: gliding motility-associated C-terminal domain-containing protein [Crocinitomicaceae bacterium]|nr:gliding motility-associated C-terminal domain-containing protein [Crocinitomicaceae bacterium]